jgi:hypothetical protein
MNESEPRAVASGAAANKLLRQLRSLPLAVLIHQQNALAKQTRFCLPYSSRDSSIAPKAPFTHRIFTNFINKENRNDGS